MPTLVDPLHQKVAPPFQLTASERQSALWLRLQSHLEDMLADLREQNDNESTPERTAKLRGRIAAVKDFLALGKPTPSVTTDH
jgi:hypothetical protein